MIRATLLLAGLVAATSAACTSAGGPDSGHLPDSPAPAGTAAAVPDVPAPAVPGVPAPAVPDVPVLASTSDRALPVEKYLINPEENARMDRGWARLVSTCMKRFGLDHEPAVRESDRRTGQTAHRYDPTDPAVAAARGYHGDASGDGPTPTPTGSLSPDVRLVLGSGSGAPQAPGGSRAGVFRGTPIPPGGCAGEAQEAVTAGGGTFQDAQVAVDVNFGNYQRSTADERVKEVFRKWSSCMKANGFDYETPTAAANDPAWHSPAPSATELATAAADVRCKRENNVVGVWFAVESAYEEREIEEKLPELTRVRESIDITLRNAAAALLP
ncbi:hypothetical protein [Kitasatospora purpeofusca]|uniref:PknH-like extracellular domain-containing protein n=1 Tax=Kitasatospora purpeofusca TaxID=67352 RepID=A0ABZ1TUB9_9ACTN|nr:hypothetical protein [Kitasatospora purpeofusca]